MLQNQSFTDVRKFNKIPLTFKIPINFCKCLSFLYHLHKLLTEKKSTECSQNISTTDISFSILLFYQSIDTSGLYISLYICQFFQKASNKKEIVVLKDEWKLYLKFLKTTVQRSNYCLKLTSQQICQGQRGF